MFDHGGVTATLHDGSDARVDLDRLRERMRRMEDGFAAAARPELDVLPGLSQVIRLRAGGSYQVDSQKVAGKLLDFESQR